MNAAVDIFIKQEVRRQLAQRNGLGHLSADEGEWKELFTASKEYSPTISRTETFAFETGEDEGSLVKKILFGVHAAMSVAGGTLGAYHGYKRNRGSLGWALAWSALGTGAPIITTAVAFAQGFGKPIKKGK